MSRSIGQRATEGAAGRIEGVDHAVPEVADEQIAAELPERRGRQRDAPRRIQMGIADLLEQVAVQVEHADEAAGYRRKLFRVLDVQLAVHGLDVERREARGEVG